MKSTILLLSFLSFAIACQKSENANLSATKSITDHQHGLVDSDQVVAQVHLNDCPEKVWPYIVIKADYFVDLDDHGELSAKEIRKEKHANPVWLRDSYLALQVKKFTGKELRKLINDKGEESFGKRYLRADKLLIDVYNNNTTWSDVDTPLAQNIAIPLPVEKVLGKSMYLMSKAERSAVEAKLIKASKCKKATFSFEIFYGSKN